MRRHVTTSSATAVFVLCVMVLLCDLHLATVDATVTTPTSAPSLTPSLSMSLSDSARISRWTLSDSPTGSQSSSASSEQPSRSDSLTFTTSRSASIVASATLDVSLTPSGSEQRRSSSKSTSPTMSSSDSPSSNASPSFPTASPSRTGASLSPDDTKSESRFSPSTPASSSRSDTRSTSLNRKAHRNGAGGAVESRTESPSSDTTQTKSPTPTSVLGGGESHTVTNEITSTLTLSGDPPTSSQSKSAHVSVSDTVTIERNTATGWLSLSTSATVSASRQRRGASRSKSPTGGEATATVSPLQTPSSSRPSITSDVSLTVTLTRSRPSRTPSTTVTLTLSAGSSSAEPSLSKSLTPSVSRLSPSSSGSESPMATQTPTLRPTFTVTITPPARITPSDTSSLTNDLTTTRTANSDSRSPSPGRTHTVASATQEVTRTSTQNITVSLTGTITPPPTPTPTQSASSSVTASSSSTDEASISASRSVTSTSTITPPPTPTPTSTQSGPSMTDDASRTNTITPPPTPTPSASASNPRSSTLTPTDTPTVPTKTRPLTLSPSREISQVMINDTFLLRLSGDGWAAALRKNYSAVFAAARSYVAASLDVPEWQVMLHSLTPGSLVISFSVNQFQPRYKNVTYALQLLLAGNTAAAQQALQQILNLTIAESVFPLGASYQAETPLVVPSSCDSTCVALIVACVVGSVGLFIIGAVILVKFELYRPLDYDFEAAAAKQEADRKAASENRVSHVHEDYVEEDDDPWDERRPAGRVKRDVIQVTSIDPRHYHLEEPRDWRDGSNSSSRHLHGQQDTHNTNPPDASFSPARRSPYSHPYLIYGHDTGADVTPHALSDDDVDHKGPNSHSPDAARQREVGIDVGEPVRHSTTTTTTASSHRRRTGDSPVLVDRSPSASTAATHSPQRSAQNSPRGQRKPSTVTIIGQHAPKMPDPSVVSRIKRPPSGGELVSSRTSNAKLSVAVGALPMSPAPSILDSSVASVVNASSSSHRTPSGHRTTTHTVARWLVPIGSSAAAGDSGEQHHSSTVFTAHTASAFDASSKSKDVSPRRPHPAHRYDPFAGIPVVPEVDIITPGPTPRPIRSELNPRRPQHDYHSLMAHDDTRHQRFKEDDAAFVEIVEVGSAMEDDYDYDDS